MKIPVLILLVGLSGAAYGAVSSHVHQGGKLYAKEKYGEALSNYNAARQEDPKAAQAHFGAGAAAYQLKDYRQAAQAFKEAADTSEELRQDALFNLGNTYYRGGEKEAAIVVYKQAILKNPKDKEAIHNLQLLLKEQQNQQNQNNQNDQNDNQDSKNQDQKDQQQNQGNSPQQQSSQDKQPQDARQDQQSQLEKQAAERVMQLARDNEYKRPSQAGQAAENDSVEKDW